MSKITVLEQKTFQNKPSGFKVTLSDGRSGNLQEKESDKGLRVGDEVNVTEIPYTSKAGVQSTLYGLRLVTAGSQPSSPAQPPAFKPTGGQIPNLTSPLTPTGVSITERVLILKAEASLKLAEVVMEAIFEGKATSDVAMAKHKEYKEYLFAIIDECAQ